MALTDDPQAQEQAARATLERRKNAAGKQAKAVGQEFGGRGGAVAGKIGGSAAGGAIGTGAGVTGGLGTGAVKTIASGGAAAPSLITDPLKYGSDFGRKGAEMGGKIGKEAGERAGKYVGGKAAEKAGRGAASAASVDQHAAIRLAKARQGGIARQLQAAGDGNVDPAQMVITGTKAATKGAFFLLSIPLWIAGGLLGLLGMFALAFPPLLIIVIPGFLIVAFAQIMILAFRTGVSTSVGAFAKTASEVNKNV